MQKRLLWLPLVLGSVAFAQEGTPREQQREDRKQPQERQQDDGKRAFTLVSQLESPDAAKRDQAMRELRQLGEQAVPALEQGARSYKTDLRLRSIILLREIGGKEYASYGDDLIREPDERDPYRDRDRYRDTYERDRYRDRYDDRYDRDRYARDRYRDDRWYEDDRTVRDRYERDRYHDRDRYDRDRFRDDRYRGDRFDRDRFETEHEMRFQQTQTVSEMGIRAADVDPALKAQLKLDRGGVVVHEIRRNTPAEELGLERYDVVVEVNNRKVQDPAELGRIIRTSRTEDGEMKVVVIRKGERKELSGKVKEASRYEQRQDWQRD